MFLFLDAARMAKADPYQSATDRVLDRLDCLQSNIDAMTNPGLAASEVMTEPGEHWRLLHGQQRMWTRVGIHSSAIVVDPAGRCYLEFTGLIDPDAATGKNILRGQIEPYDRDCCDMPRHKPDTIWQGSEQEMAEKVYRLCRYVDRQNKKKERYRLFRHNCNTMLHEMLDEIGVETRLKPRGWMPGKVGCEVSKPLEPLSVSPERTLEIFRALPEALLAELPAGPNKRAPWLPRLSDTTLTLK